MARTDEDLGDGFGLGNEWVVTLRESRLGMTLENVLEQTIVHEVDSNGAAYTAGVRAGLLVVAVGDESTSGLLHDEVIEKLRRPTRPLRVRLRQVEASRLEKRRRESRAAAAAVSASWEGIAPPAQSSPAATRAALRALKNARFAPADLLSIDDDDLDALQGDDFDVTPFVDDHMDVDDHMPPSASASASASSKKKDDAAFDDDDGDGVDDDDDDEEDEALTVEKCAAALAVLDDALGSSTATGAANRRAAFAEDLQPVIAKACCECLEYASYARPSRHHPKFDNGEAKSKFATSLQQHQQNAKVDDDDADLAFLVGTLSIDCGSFMEKKGASFTAFGTSSSLSHATVSKKDSPTVCAEAAARYSAAAALVG
eukprot:CAMPEP_0118900278 /NCGR_PEP_ID=MMETSP1166-20130328/6463_1 /TAXON_ID=1104430 /ORGANISM="Chrysoreinhardia sp, Strain CCMP3193" /LENGTH=371 /DNA_ID=CAMNT_0006839417 /DNA_START=105 /DNA_END=1216 /DNA_ORIENTATION=-